MSLAGLEPKNDSPTRQDTMTKAPIKENHEFGGQKGPSHRLTSLIFTYEDPKTPISDCPKATGLVRLVSSRLVLEHSSPPAPSPVSFPSTWPPPLPERGYVGLRRTVTSSLPILFLPL